MKKGKKWIIGICGILILLGMTDVIIEKMRNKVSAEITVRKDGTTVIDCKTKQTGEEYVIYQLPMTDTPGGACYAIKLPNGKLIMIDSGYVQDGEPIREFIMEHGGKVDSWFITHPHFDHIGGLLANLRESDNPITIDKIYYNPFTEEFFEEEKLGKDLEVINKALMFEEFEQYRTGESKAGIKSEISYLPIVKGDVVDIEGVRITCMNSFDENLYDVNGNSLALHLDIRDATMMITGDITDASVSNMELAYEEGNAMWEVDFLQIPHHGYMAGISDDRLYQLTKPQTAFVDCSTSEYLEDAVSIKTHLQMLENLKIPVIKRFEGVNQVVIH